MAIEVFSVLTRMPQPRRAPADLVIDSLDHHPPDPPLVLDGAGHGQVLRAAAERRILGGRIYDALIAAAAAAAGAQLLTLGARAVSAYEAHEALGVDHRLLAD